MVNYKQFNFNTALILLNDAEINKEVECTFWGYGRQSKTFKVRLVRGFKNITVYVNDTLRKVCDTEGQILDIMMKEADGLL